MFSDTTPRLEAGGLPATGFFAIVAVQVSLGIWSFVLSIKAVAEAQSFSGWRALSNFVLAGSIVFVPIVALVGIVHFLR